MAENKNQGNLRYYNMLKAVPQEALKPILAGRLKGKSDINPVWRMKAMTEAFGPCGVGWKYEITKQWQETYGPEVKAFTQINLYIKVDGEWSDPIPGTGGATLVEAGKNGSYVNDEGYKCSLTDALSVAMKALGVAADVYFSGGIADADNKYSQEAYVAPQQNVPEVKKVSDTATAKKELAACKYKEEVVDVNNKYPHLFNYQPYTQARDERWKQLPNMPIL